MVTRLSAGEFWHDGTVHFLIDPDKWTVERLGSLLPRLRGIVASLVVGGSYIHKAQFDSIMDCAMASGFEVGNLLGASSPGECLSDGARFVLVPVVFGACDTQYVLDHVIRAVPYARNTAIPWLTYAYVQMGPAATSARFFTRASPVPRGCEELIETLAVAAERLNLGGIYLEAGSGAQDPVTVREVAAARRACSIPVLVGGGLKSLASCEELFRAGATAAIVGTSLEQGETSGWLK